MPSSSLRLLLNGRLLPTADHSDLSEAELVIRSADDDQPASRDFSEDITFYGTAYDEIRALLIDDPNFRENFLTAEIRDDCCETLLFTGRITADNIEWCQDGCAITATLTEYTPQTAAEDCLKSVIISDNFDGFRYRMHPFVRYCIELRPAFLQDLILIFALLFNLILLVLYPVVAILALVVALVNIIIDLVPCGEACEEIDEALDVNLLEEYTGFIENINSMIIGCGKGQISPLIRDYITNICTRCGLTFNAGPRSIFGFPASPYFNTVYFHAPFHAGSREYELSGGGLNAGTIETYWNENGPSETGTTFLAALCHTFYARPRIVGTELFLEHKADLPPEIINWDAVPENQRIELCYEYTGKTQPAYARVEYTPDAVDWVGNEAKSRFNGLISYNSPVFSPNRKGEEKITFPFGISRFRDDGIDRDVLSDYRSFPFIGPLISSDFDGLLILPVGVAFQAKLLIWDGTSSRDNARIIRHPRPGGDYDYNRDFFAFPYFYDRFWSVTDPRVRPERGIRFRMRIAADCEYVRTFPALVAEGASAGLPPGLGRITEVRFSKREMTVIGIV